MASCPHDLISLLDLPYEIIPPQIDDDIIVEKYEKARERGEREGFYPILVVNSELLYQSVLSNLNKNGDHSFEAIKESRDYYLKHDLNSGKQILQDRYNLFVEEFNEDIDSFDDLYLQEVGDEIEPQKQALSYWDYESGHTKELILFEVPVDDPYRIIAYLPFGQWNDCPSNLNLMSICKYFYEEYKALPFCISQDEFDIKFYKKIPQDKTLDLAKEFYALAPSTLFDTKDDTTLIGLAKALEDSDYWTFWWE